MWVETPNKLVNLDSVLAFKITAECGSYGIYAMFWHGVEKIVDGLSFRQVGVVFSAIVDAIQYGKSKVFDLTGYISEMEGNADDNQ